jgi:hypothetical protein
MMKYSKKISAATFLVLAAMTVGSGMAHAVIAGSVDRSAVNGSAVSVNGAKYDVNIDEMIKEALRSGATPAAALAQTIEAGFGQVEALSAAVRAGIDPSAIQQAAQEVGIDQDAIDAVFGTR